MQDLDATAREAESNIAQTEALLGQATAMLDRSKKELEAAGGSPDLARGFMGRRTAEEKAAFEREVQGIKDEIERDLPRQTATRTARVKPTRQMV